MIGYVSPFKPELKYKEMALYKAYYCSICKAIKKTVGRPFCFGLSHDLTGILFLQSSLNPTEETFRKETCIWNPFNKVNVLTNYQDEINEKAILNILLVYYKAKDNRMDKKTLFSFLSQMVLWIRFNKLAEKNKEMNDSIELSLRKYNQNEYAENMSLEMVIDPYASMIGTLISQSITDPYIKKCFYWIGYHIAKSTCIIDAMDDYEDDYKHKTNNILHPKHMKRQYSKIIAKNINKEKDTAGLEVQPILQYSLYQIRTTIGLLPILKNQSIIDNIFTLGMNNSMEKAFTKEEERI